MMLLALRRHWCGGFVTVCVESGHRPCSQSDTFTTGKVDESLSTMCIGVVMHAATQLATQFVRLVTCRTHVCETRDQSRSSGRDRRARTGRNGQTCFSFHRPRLNSSALTTASVQNATVAAAKTPCGPKPS